MNITFIRYMRKHTLGSFILNPVDRFEMTLGLWHRQTLVNYHSQEQTFSLCDVSASNQGKSNYEKVYLCHKPSIISNLSMGLNMKPLKVCFRLEQINVILLK